MGTLLIIVAVVFGVIAGAFFLLGGRILKKRHFTRSSVTFLVGIIFLLLMLLTGFLSVSTHGYKALTREELIAVVETRQSGPQTFEAIFYFPDKSNRSFVLAGDELYVDAHILKWKPVANLVGIHTLYELDRVAGRYTDLSDEQTNMRTVYSLSRDKPLDLFNLRRRYPVLGPLVDAQYGSATFIMAEARQQYELRVSTTGLLIRRVEL